MTVIGKNQAGENGEGLRPEICMLWQKLRWSKLLIILVRKLATIQDANSHLSSFGKRFCKSSVELRVRPFPFHYNSSWNNEDECNYRRIVLGPDFYKKKDTLLSKVKKKWQKNIQKKEDKRGKIQKDILKREKMT